jgi:hypothetical protein
VNFTGSGTQNGFTNSAQAVTNSEAGREVNGAAAAKTQQHFSQAGVKKTELRTQHAYRKSVMQF